MRRTYLTCVALVIAAIGASAPASDANAQASVESFYKGKDIRVLIGAGVGGAFAAAFLRNLTAGGAHDGVVIDV